MQAVWVLSFPLVSGLDLHYRACLAAVIVALPQLQPVLFGHDSAHEFIEERSGEGGSAVALTADHALGYQVVSNGTKGVDRLAQNLRDVPDRETMLRR